MLSLDEGAGRVLVHDHEAQLRQLGLDGRYTQMSPGDYAGEIEWTHFGGVQIVHEWQNANLLKEVAMGDNLCTISYLWGRDTTARLGEQILHRDTIGHFPARAEMDFQAPTGLGATFFVFDNSRFLAAARSFDPDWERAPTAPVARGAQTLDTLEGLARELSRAFGLADRLSPARIEALCLSAALETFHDGHLGASPVTSRQAYRLVRAARAHIADTMGEPLTVLDLCQAVGASRKALQAAFNAVLGMPPARYLRIARLNHARTRLRAGEPGQHQVSDIAFSAGFWHMSKFAQDYRAQFGELPSETLAAPARRYQAVGS